MNKEPRKVHAIFEELRDRASYPFLFYIPKSYVEVFMEEKLLNEIDWAFDVLIVARKKMDIIFIDDKDESQEVFKKQSALKENLFDLAEYESVLNPAQFSILINNYKDHLFAMQYLAALLVMDVHSSKDERYKKYLGHFTLQNAAYVLHKSGIDKDFPSFRKTQAEEDFMRECVMINLNIPEILQEEIAPPKQKVKKKKQLYIADEESQKYLLETVFDIKIE